ncbi:hypothetical protein QP933_09105 [Corynebacterium pseudodiphtheriticum]|uniref:hypothetical protein n=1 Tax=Corynebacterium pseudodiphtheriticum TaxID=37637 RepID=UPI00255044CC|nr:hypothetical protein [Corynebacterium pseudodiphtheriticum]MDK8477343.1 hypothetical protein [Corynebacterium pseudodiphtheriticum]MDK8485649.1 hypothetical protein [Corynebacterium pseudodiphtheriticum]MDK8492882.1 hypothetical protein [Corynebacterium pseudodiphtheriticum]MDK8501081.1 hypothetical protein [Corynebacterium pseudodiphtheriticum]MDK8584589.1 hypothetical protein [Corynebacterium pseudodiphtheriticum]
MNIRFRSTHFRPYAIPALVFVTGAALAACADNPAIPGADVPEMGNATPVPSSTQVDASGLVGEVIARPEFSEVSDMAVAGKNLALRMPDSLWLGTVDELADAGSVIDIAAECGELTATEQHFILACGDFLQVIPAGEAKAERITPKVDFPITAATRMNNGDLVVASEKSAEVAMVTPTGEVISRFTAAAPTDQLVHVESKSHGEQLVRTWREDTTIQNLDWRNERGGGTLRVGLGVGEIAVGDEGLVLATDARGEQLAVYTALDVIRLHQTVPAPAGPWAVAWDSERDVAWTASTKENLLTAFRISSGVPQQAGQLKTIPDAQSLVVADDGTVVLASATGHGIQVITEPELSNSELSEQPEENG